jgi:hypothetical protein
MAVTVSVPVNTMLADLDETLRALLRRELSRHGYDGVNVAFDAPTKEWSAALSGPTVNLFLYDLREAVELRQKEWREQRGNGSVRRHRPPLWLECSYAVTAWARAVEDEHRLLSDVMAVLYAYELLPQDELIGTLADATAQRGPIGTRIARPKTEDKSDFWTALGGTYHVALDYIVTLSCEPGVSFERGPEVRTAAVRIRDRDLDRSAVEELHHAGGRVTDQSGAPVAKVWLVLPDLGAWSESDEQGRFRLARLPRGEHRLLARGPGGTELETTLAVPRPAADITLPSSAKKRR